MSDHCIVISPKCIKFQNKELKVKEVLSWLISKDIIKAELSDCTLNSESGYSVSDGAKDVSEFPIDLPFDLDINGLEIIVNRAIYGDYPEEIKCPCCNTKFEIEDLEVADWLHYDSDELICPKCNKGSDPNAFTFIPETVFSDLSFKFWNWPEFKDTFLKEFEEKLETPVSEIYTHW